MPVTFQPCGQDVRDLCNELIDQHHAHLREYKVAIDLIFAFGPKDPDTGETVGPALKHGGGYEALGLARILSLKDRAKGMGDCEISLDGDRWPEMTPRQQMALVDHELTHFQMRIDPETYEVKYDDLGRPMLTMKLHDYDIGWFHSIAERYGQDSSEVAQFRSLFINGRTRRIYFEETFGVGGLAALAQHTHLHPEEERDEEDEGFIE